MANPIEKRTINLDGEDQTFESITHLENRIKSKYENFLKYQEFDKDCFADDVIRDMGRIAQQLLDLIGHYDVWADDINKWHKEQSEKALSDLWTSIRNLPPDPFNEGRPR